MRRVVPDRSVGWVGVGACQCGWLRDTYGIFLHPYPHPNLLATCVFIEQVVIVYETLSFNKEKS